MRRGAERRLQRGNVQLNWEGFYSASRNAGGERRAGGLREQKAQRGAELYEGRWEGLMKPPQAEKGKLYLPHNAPLHSKCVLTSQLSYSPTLAEKASF